MDPSLCCVKVGMKSTNTNHPYKEQFGGYRLFLNIEEDYVTSNSNVVFRQLKAPNFIYQDRHGNWIAGNDVGDPRGHIRSHKSSQNLDCPCQVEKWQSWDEEWKDDDTVSVTKVKTYGHDYTYSG
eukprot:TRINITY_DN33908_c0_g1_i1.p2 TRINITY_DN33908_c0_g1~~TRINITY_DN33908_c0_g1_i1.p2  ORF type:complete len:125 (-),score=27.20 TRINITY_DN33908_c0_g1_i1:75-449(-)